MTQILVGNLDLLTELEYTFMAKQDSMIKTTEIMCVHGNPQQCIGDLILLSLVMTNVTLLILVS